MILTAKKGSNRFNRNGWPIPILPTFRKVLSYSFKIDSTWFEGDLTEPLQYGVKLPAIGKFNYHNSGANFAIAWVKGKLLLYPRLYTGKNDLKRWQSKGIELKPNIWYDCEIYNFRNGIVFEYGDKMFISDYDIKGHWISPAWIGSRNKAVAIKDLKLEIKY